MIGKRLWMETDVAEMGTLSGQHETHDQSRPWNPRGDQHHEDNLPKSTRYPGSRSAQVQVQPYPSARGSVNEITG